MMVTALISCSLLANAPQPSNEFRIAVRAESDSVTAIRLPNAARADLRAAEVHMSGRRVVVFVPNMQADSAVRDPQRGPVAKVRVNPAKRGTAIVLVGRGRGLTKDSITVKPAVGVIEVSSVAFAKRPAANEAADEAAQGAELARQIERVKAELQSSDASSDASSDSSVSDLPAGVLAALPTKKDASVSPNRMFYLALALLAVAAVGFMLRKRKGLATETDSIDVVAVKPFGGKHKLALIETGGDRLLVAASDKEVRVLSHVRPDGEAIEGLRRPTMPTGATPKFVQNLEPSFASALSSETDAVRRRSQRIDTQVSDDLTGLLRLRQGRGSDKGVAA